MPIFSDSVRVAIITSSSNIRILKEPFASSRMKLTQVDLLSHALLILETYILY